ncbi:MAG: DUF4389 domain-containing protein [Nocardioidaceae bacterium]
MASSTYPVTVQAHLEPNLSRWLWLVKWLLAIPHYIVLAFLWLAFVVLSAVAMVAILFTGRYPESIFDFNVGVLRWTWRVAVYTYGALGTDRYPPFTLSNVPDYPAHLEVERPERLSRGLVLIKWWLLALPHYLIVGLLIGSGAGFAAGYRDTNNGTAYAGGSGLIGVLVLIAAVILLFTGRYPQQLFDLVLGLNRWVLRVAAYAGLMTDRYPPFRLDMGEDEPGATITLTPPSGPGGPGGPAGPPVQPTPTAAAVSEPRSGSGTGRPWTAGRVLAVVVGSFAVLGALGLGASAAALGIGAAVLRDDAGFVMTDTTPLQTPTHALLTQNIRLDGGSMTDRIVGDVRVRATSGSGAPIFVGLARTGDALRYLDGVSRSTVVDLSGMVGRTMTPTYRSTPGGAPTVIPAKAGIWAASSVGNGTRTLRVQPQSGNWTLVVMNADGSRGVAADVAAGATFPALGWTIAALLLGALLALALGAALIAVGLHHRPAAPGSAASGPSGPEPPSIEEST